MTQRGNRREAIFLELAIRRFNILYHVTVIRRRSRWTFFLQMTLTPFFLLKLPKLAKLMDDAEADVLAYMTFPAAHRAKLHSTNPIERVNGKIKRRTDVVGIFPSEAAITRLVGAILMERSEEWAVQRARYTTLETMATMSDDPIVVLSAVPGA